MDCLTGLLDTIGNRFLEEYTTHLKEGKVNEPEKFDSFESTLADLLDPDHSSPDRLGRKSGNDLKTMLGLDPSRSIDYKKVRDLL